MNGDCSNRVETDFESGRVSQHAGGWPGPSGAERNVPRDAGRHVRGTPAAARPALPRPPRPRTLCFDATASLYVSGSAPGGRGHRWGALGAGLLGWAVLLVAASTAQTPTDRPTPAIADPAIQREAAGPNSGG